VIYSLLAVSRSQLGQYIAGAGAFELGLRHASRNRSVHEKRISELKENRQAVGAQLYNRGIAAVTAAGDLESSPPPNAPQLLHYRNGPYTGALDPEVAIADTTDFSSSHGWSSLEEAAVCFELSTYFLPDEADAYSNLSYVMRRLGRLDDAVGAAERGLSAKPGHAGLEQNLRAARASIKLREAGALERASEKPLPYDSTAASQELHVLRERFRGFVSDEGYGKSKWGQSRKTVRSLYPTAQLASDSTLFLKDQIGGSPAVVWFEFVSNKLVSVSIRQDAEHVNKSLYISDYQRLQQRLREKYGPAEEDVNWLNSLYKEEPEQYGMAISVGHLRLSTTWETPKTHIRLACTGENFKLFVLISYTSRELDELRSKSELLRDLEKL
jgi:tetratricopeptide (TPR) repeat protein